MIEFIQLLHRLDCPRERTAYADHDKPENRCNCGGSERHTALRNIECTVNQLLSEKRVKDPTLLCSLIISLIERLADATNDPTIMELAGPVLARHWALAAELRREWRAPAAPIRP